MWGIINSFGTTFIRYIFLFFYIFQLKNRIPSGAYCLFVPRSLGGGQDPHTIQFRSLASIVTIARFYQFYQMSVQLQQEGLLISTSVANGFFCYV